MKEDWSRRRARVGPSERSEVGTLASGESEPRTASNAKHCYAARRGRRATSEVWVLAERSGASGTHTDTDDRRGVVVLHTTPRRATALLDTAVLCPRHSAVLAQRNPWREVGGRGAVAPRPEPTSRS